MPDLPKARQGELFLLARLLQKELGRCVVRFSVYHKAELRQKLHSVSVLDVEH